MGGFIAGQYARKYPHNMKGLIMLSPLGVPKRPEHMTVESIHDRSSNCLHKYGVDWFNEFWEKEALAPLDVVRSLGGYVGKNLIVKNINSRVKIADAQTKNAFANYIHQTALRKKSSE